jgi:hypothetical protein
MSENRAVSAQPFPWEGDPDLIMARANYMACAYNAAVNYGTDRGHRKMWDLIRAINAHDRAEGVAKLEYLKRQNVIDSYTPCPAECEVRPGGLFHVSECENEWNHSVSHARRERARELLPLRATYAASVSLVGSVQS